MKGLLTTFLLYTFVFFLMGCSTFKQATDKTAGNQDKVLQAESIQPLLSPEYLRPPGEELEPGPIPTDPEVKIGTLSNGMRYYIKHNPTPKGYTELRLVVAAGSVHETDGQKGLAHFVEHMAFNGTKSFSKNALVDYLEKMGTRFGPDLNAFTSFEVTAYKLQVPSKDEARLDTGLLILKEWAADVTFEGEEIDKERGVILAEWRTRKGPMERLFHEIFTKIYKGSRYAERLPIGDTVIIKHAPYDTLRAYYRKWYRPDNQAIIVVGDINPDSVEQKIRTLFSRIPAPKDALHKPQYTLSTLKGTRILTFKDPEMPYMGLQLFYQHPHHKLRDRSDYEAHIKRELMIQMLNARLREYINSADPPFIMASANYGYEFGGKDELSVFALVPEGAMEKAVKTLFEEMKRIREQGFVASELERAKKEMLQQARQAVKEKGKTHSRKLASKFISHFLIGNPIPSPEQHLAMVEGVIHKIALDEINTIARALIVPNRRATVLFGPESASANIPDEKQVFNWIVQAETAPIDAYVDQSTAKSFFNIPLSPKPIQSIQHDETLGLDIVQLPNGVKVLLKKTDFKNDEVLVYAFSPGGHGQYNYEKYLQARYADDVINASGVGDFSKNDLQKYLAGKDVSLRSFITTEEEGLRGHASPKDLELLFQWIYQLFTAPRKDTAALKGFIKKQKGFLANLTKHPNVYFNDRTQRLLYQNHPRRRMPTPEELDKLQIDTLMEAYRDRFGDASDFTFVFVGNFDRDTILQYIQKYLANLPSTSRKEAFGDDGARLLPKDTTATWKEGTDPKALVQLTWHESFDDSESERVKFYAAIKALNIHLRQIMREEMGDVYFVVVHGRIHKLPTPHYRVMVYFNAFPNRVDTLIQVVHREIQKLTKDGIPPDLLQKVKALTLEERKKSLEENDFWLNSLASLLKDQRDLKEITLERLQYHLEALTERDIQDAIKKYILNGHHITAIQYPETASKE